MAAVSHSKSDTVADFTGTVTVNNSQGSTQTIAATDLVRPVDWNSAHNFFQTLTGNTSNSSTMSGTNMVLGGTGAITLAASTAAGAGTVWVSAPPVSQLTVAGNLTLSSNGSTVTISAPAQYTALSYQNRQYGASSTVTAGQNSLWLVPFRVVVPVSVSTLAHVYSFSGTITSAATARAGATMQYAIYSQDTADANKFDTWWSGERNFTFWNSGTSSYSYSYNVTSGSSAGSNLGTASVMGQRLITVAVGSTLTPGLYLYGSRISSSSAGYSAAMSRMMPVQDAPLNIGMGFMGSATNSTIGIVDAGTWTSATTGAIPASVSIGHIAPFSNLVPVFKLGAI